MLGGSISHSHHVKVSIEQMSSSFVFFLSSSDFYSVCQPSFSPAHPCKRQGKTLGRHPSRTRGVGVSYLPSTVWWLTAQTQKHSSRVETCGVALWLWWHVVLHQGAHYRPPPYELFSPRKLTGSRKWIFCLIVSNWYLFLGLCFAFCSSLLISQTHTCTPTQKHRHGLTSTNTLTKLSGGCYLQHSISRIFTICPIAVMRVQTVCELQRGFIKPKISLTSCQC